MPIGIVLVIVASIVVALLAGFGVFDPKVDDALPNTTGPGWWKATAPGLGSFEFKLNNDQSAITEFVFQIPNITCPDITYSVTSVDVQNNPPLVGEQRPVRRGCRHRLRSEHR